MDSLTTEPPWELLDLFILNDTQVILVLHLHRTAKNHPTMLQYLGTWPSVKSLPWFPPAPGSHIFQSSQTGAALTVENYSSISGEAFLLPLFFVVVVVVLWFFCFFWLFRAKSVALGSSQATRLWVKSSELQLPA